MRHLTYIFCFFLFVISCQSQTKKNKSNNITGGPCEGCEAIFEFGNRVITSTDTLPNFQINEPKMKISGVVFKKDGKTPAENAIIYIYHTNRDGIYETKGNEEGWAKRHGFIRGWTKTDPLGRYTFLTFRPAAYPDAREPEHVHMTIKEPDRNEYYIDEIVFIDDPKLTFSKMENLNNRGGSGVVQLNKVNGILIAKRNIILGLNIPNYD